MSPDPEVTDLKVIEDDFYKSRAIVFYEPARDAIITGFRGSSNVMNWLENIDFVKIDYTLGGCQDCQVHKGFFNSYNCL